MATTGNARDVRLGIEIETAGEEGVRRLAQDIRGIGEAGAAAAPDAARLTAELDRLTAATAERRDAERTARADAAAARAAFNEQRDALARLTAQTDQADKSTTEYRDAERSLRVAVVESRIALRERTAAATAAAVEARTAAAAETRVAEQLRATAAAATAAARAQVQGATESAGAIELLGRQLSALRNVAGLALGGSLVGSLAKEVSDTADSFQNLSARVKIATGTSGDFKATLQGVFDVANRTGVAVDDVGALVVKLTQAGKELGITNAEALALAETVTEAIQVGGASAQEAAAATLQFSQAIASGKLGGDELRSILEGAPVLAKALADGLGVTVGKLKELGSTGALTAQQVVAALQGQSDAVQRQFDTLPLTVGRSLTVLSNEWERYVGSASQGSGATQLAATAIQALATHLDTAAAVLYSAGKAAAAYAAVRLAQTFIESATAARAAAAATAVATAATTAHTVATAANTGAQVANAAATAGSVATAGRLAGVLSTLKTFTLIGVLTNLREIGTAAGEGAARLAGYGKAIENLEIAQRADEQATRAAANSRAALAQSTQQATDKALGLTDAARKLVAEFDGVIVKGDGTTEALEKLSKALQLGDLTGITAAGAALDALGQRGKLTGEQIRTALADALKGDDLAVFATNARAAFDSTEQGARRLAAALAAVDSEALRRAGTSAAELATGFSTAATAAIGDVDALDRALLSLGQRGNEAGRALAGSLDKALAAAATERAVQAVIDRWQALGEAGRITGDALTDGLERARKKLDDLKPGIQSLEEAMRSFGLKTREELVQIADRLGEVRISAIVDAHFRLIVDGESRSSWRRWGSAQELE